MTTNEFCVASVSGPRKITSAFDQSSICKVLVFIFHLINVGGLLNYVYRTNFTLFFIINVVSNYMTRFDLTYKNNLKQRQ